MKTRNGFVSNSSSCSFVLLGIKINAKELNVDYSELMELFDDFDILTDEDVETLSKDEIIVGNEIKESQYSIYDLINIGKNISIKITKNVGWDDLTLEQVKLYTGVRMC